MNRIKQVLRAVKRSHRSTRRTVALCMAAALPSLAILTIKHDVIVLIVPIVMRIGLPRRPY